MTHAEGKESYVFKLLLLGDAGVGKSCLLLRFVNKRYTNHYYATVGIDFKLRTVEVAGCVVKLQIWDTAGEERFRSIVRSYYRGAHGIILVYDTTARDSFEHVNFWLDEIQRNADENVNIMLVGNKCDDYDQRCVGYQNAATFAERRGIPFVEASAKSGINVDQLFGRMVVSIYDRLVMPSVAGPRAAEAPANRQCGKPARVAAGGATPASKLKPDAGNIRLRASKRAFRESNDPCCY